MFWIRPVLRGLVFFFIFGLLSHSWAISQESRPPGRGGTLSVGMAADPLSLEPSNAEDAESALICSQIFETLVRFREESLRLSPGLALSWKSSSDGLTWVFHLKKNVYFQDGTPFTAESVRFNFKRMMETEHPYHLAKNWNFSCWKRLWGGFPGIVREVTVIDEHTLRIRLSRPTTAFLANLASGGMAIQSPAAIMRWKENLYRHPVGTGPFRFVYWTRGERCVLEANRDYREGKPLLDRLIFYPISSNRDRAERLSRGIIDLMEVISPPVAGELKSRREISILQARGLNVGYVAINCQQYPFEERKVRQALNFAIDRESIIRNFYSGRPLAARSVIPEGILRGKVESKAYDYSRGEALRLLEEAGYPQGFETTLYYADVPRLYLPEPEKIAMTVQRNLADIGVRANLVRCSQEEFTRVTRQGEHGLALYGFMADNGDPGDFVSILLGPGVSRMEGPEPCFYWDDDLRGLAVKAQMSLDPLERDKLFRRIQDLLYEEAPWMPLVNASQMIAYHEKVKGLRLHPLRPMDLSRVWIKH